MKTKLWILLSVGFLLTASSCTKEKKGEQTGNNGIIGKWKFVEMYDGYANGGTYTWQPVAAANSHSLEFTTNGQYAKKEASGQQCSGTYQLLAKDSLSITSNCLAGAERTKISELTVRNLILDYRAREGVIRYKYVPE